MVLVYALFFVAKSEESNFDVVVGIGVVKMLYAKFLRFAVTICKHEKPIFESTVVNKLSQLIRTNGKQN